MDGVLDGEYDLLPRIAPNLGKPLAWCKTTISSFRLSELVSHYEDEGWTVSPLLIVRDVRDTWASLLVKPYGVNGFTAEDPPLRLRFRRFKEDWELFQAKGWPILRYESLVENHETTLRETCRRLALPWDDSMLHWTKRANQIADASRGSESFRQTQGRNLAETLARYSAQEEKRDHSLAAAIWPGSKTSFRRSMQKTAIPSTCRLRRSGRPEFGADLQFSGAAALSLGAPAKTDSLVAQQPGRAGQLSGWPLHEKGGMSGL